MMMNLGRILEAGLGQAGNDEIEVCKVCKEPLERNIELFGQIKRVRKICSCTVKIKAEKERIEREKERQIYLNRIVKNSLMDSRYKDATFQNWNYLRGNSKLFNVIQSYAEQYKRIKEDNIGLIIYGNPGCGKTYGVCCIANYLLAKGVPTICISINGILDRIKSTYDPYGREEEESIIRSFSSADFLIIDDLGTELKNEWTSSRVYRIIDGRYRNNLPTIITTNLTLKDIRNRYDERVYDRIREMCTSVICDGKSIREEISKEKSEKLNFKI
ncbi:MAG: ATP-binding protein [Clostridium sp.]